MMSQDSRGGTAAFRFPGPTELAVNWIGDTSESESRHQRGCLLGMRF